MADQMREAGLRVTRPRVMVYELLQELGGHHSADEVLQQLQARQVSLSRASVFNVLSDLTGAGLVMLCDAGPGRTLYEAFDHWHHHFVCRKCQCILDVPCTLGEKPCLHPALPGEGYQVDEAQVIFRGLCPACTKRRPGTADQA